MAEQEAMEPESEPKPKPMRLAPPSLFVPPSRNVSSTDLAAAQQSAQAPTSTTISASTRLPLARKRTPEPSTSETPSDTASPRSAQISQQQQSEKRTRKTSTTSQNWAELQNTLEEVELSAASGTNVFGAEHSRALEELRKAQVELARAWARGEEGEQQGDDVGDDAALDLSSGQAMRENSAVLASDRGHRMSHTPKPSTGKDSTSKARLDAKTQLEEETENDILLARKRRLANDRYFERVNKGVVDVVKKLDIVAEKMGGVETESQEIWGDKDSLAS